MSISLCAVGDVIVDREDPDSIFALAAPLIREADISFCQLETMYSERGEPRPQSRAACRAHPRNAVALKNAGFDIVSLSGNHTMDWGPDALFDTVDTLQNLGLSVLGVGKNIDEARKPVIMERNGIKVAFLAYATILPFGSWATEDRPGCVPMRGWTIYEQVEHDQPGTPARIHTFPNREDLAAMVSDIKKAKELANVVIVSHHWGLHFVPAAIPDYAIDVGHATIDAGADLILGHHAHILKGIEVYKGKVIFHSLCNFAFDLPNQVGRRVFEHPRMAPLRALNPTWTTEAIREWPDYPWPPDSRKTVLVKGIISDKQIERVSFVPVLINKQAQPEPLTEGDKRFNEVVDYIEELSQAAGLATKYKIEAGEVLPL